MGSEASVGCFFALITGNRSDGIPIRVDALGFAGSMSSSWGSTVAFSSAPDAVRGAPPFAPALTPPEAAVGIEAAASGPPVAGPPVAGPPVPGAPVAGAPVAGVPVTGLPVTGRAVAGAPVAGAADTGPAVPGRAVTGPPVAGP
ncbi:MAG TPA: hypothetical protein VEJ84_07670, partial [Acidimicrobiales bacterium]|nr:hypothetical protein [Acidimicrobiales bacterium]